MCDESGSLRHAFHTSILVWEGKTLKDRKEGCFLFCFFFNLVGRSQVFRQLKNIVKKLDKIKQWMRYHAFKL